MHNGLDIFKPYRYLKPIYLKNCNFESNVSGISSKICQEILKVGSMLFFN